MRRLLVIALALPYIQCGLAFDPYPIGKYDPEWEVLYIAPVSDGGAQSFRTHHETLRAPNEVVAIKKLLLLHPSIDRAWITEVRPK